jgi:predicted metal-dependent phosphoesterase TrpH
MIGDVHIHSKYSPDSNSEPDEIIKFAKMKGLDFIAIADHNRFHTHKGDIITIPAEEVSSKDGHVLALFIDREIPSSLSQEETVELIHEGNGIAVVAHPFRLINGVRSSFRNIYDAIETKNGRCMSGCNEKASMLARSLGKPMTAGSDAHFYDEIGRTYIKTAAADVEDIRKAILSKDVEPLGQDLSVGGQFKLYYKIMTERAKRGFKRI